MTSTPDSAHRRTHLKRLSLSVGPSGQISLSASSSAGLSRASMLNAHNEYATRTPDKFSQSGSPFASTSSSPGPSLLIRSPLSASATGSRRTRPLSLYSPSTTHTASSFASPSLNDSAEYHPLTSPSSSSEDIHAASPSPRNRARQHPLHEEEDCPDSSIGQIATSPAPSAFRRSLLGRSPNTRRQGSISYARSTSASIPSSPAGDSASTTPRGTPSLYEVGGSVDSLERTLHATISPTKSRSTAGHPILSPLDNDEAGASEQAETTNIASCNHNELNVGIGGARSADLLTFIAKKERKCMDLREELKRNEEELAQLKRKWESMIQRNLTASRTAEGSAHSDGTSTAANVASDIHATAAAPGLLSTITASLSGSTSSTPAATSVKQGASSRRLLTTRHSISVASPSQLSPNAPALISSYFVAPEDPRNGTESSEDSVQATEQSQYDVVGKMAKSWLGGMMKSASTIIETIAPVPTTSSTNDLDTVREEDEPEEDDTAQRHHSDCNNAAHGDTAGRRTSNATASSSVTSGSPSSAFDDDGRFSVAASRSSSVSSMTSVNSHAVNADLQSSESEASLDTVKSAEHWQQRPREDTTPVATPVLPAIETPRADASGASVHTDELWNFANDFEDLNAREQRERMESARIGVSHPSPRVSSPPAVGSPALKHGRRRSTAFELGGAFGSMIGKKYSELANSETFRNSKRATLSFVDSVEKTLTEAITVEAGVEAAAADELARKHAGSTMPSSSGEIIPSTSSPPLVPPPPATSAGAMSWTSFLRTKPTTPAVPSVRTGKSRRTASTTSLAPIPDGDIGETSMSPPLASASVMMPTTQSRHGSGSDNLQQARLQASRARHNKRASQPHTTPSPVDEVRRSARPGSGLGAGLEKVAEVESLETEEAWGW